MTTAPTQQLFDCRDAWATALIEAATADERVVAVVNDSIGSSKLGEFQKQFPDRTINVGIAEQNMVGVAAGLANAGRIPFVSAAGCFLTARAMEQIKVDVAYSGYPVILVGQSPGVAYGDLGPTHHSIEDLAWLRTIPGLSVIVPADPVETAQAVHWAARSPAPTYLRIPRMAVPEVYPQGYSFAPGVSVELRAGDDVTIIVTGTPVSRALQAADQLAQRGVSARVVAMASVKPLDEQAVLRAARQTRGIVTVEEALVSGLGGAVAELVGREHPTRVEPVGFRDTFAVTGSAPWLFDLHHISATGITDAALRVLR